MTELPKRSAGDSPTTQVAVVKVFWVDDRYSPPMARPSIRKSLISWVTQIGSVNLKRSNHKSMIDLAMHPNEGSRR